MAKARDRIDIPGVERSTLRVTIEGDTPLLSHRFSDEARAAILAKQTMRARPARGPKDPEADYQGSIYRTYDGQPGFPASAIKSACVSACRFLPMTMVEARGAILVRGDILPIEGEPRMREDVVKLNGKTADIRFRAEYPTWSITADIMYNPRVITAESIVNILETAGFHIGLGDWRPEKGGMFGMFHVKSLYVEEAST